MPAPDVCIYHDNCDDGFGAAWAVYRRWADHDIEYVPAQYGQPPRDVTGKEVLIVDFSYKADVLQEMGEKAKRVIVLDHHKTAQAELENFVSVENGFGGPVTDVLFKRIVSGVVVHFDMEKSGARLAWEYCFNDVPMPGWLACVEDRDLWRFRLPQTRNVSAAIRSYPRHFHVWSDFDHDRLAEEGRAIRRYISRVVENIADTAFKIDIDGHTVPVASCSYDFVSEVAHELLKRNPSAPFAACMVSSYDGTTLSLRSTDERLDVGQIARAHGGGGHRNAAGYRLTETLS